MDSRASEGQEARGHTVRAVCMGEVLVSRAPGWAGEGRGHLWLRIMVKLHTEEGDI